MRVLLIEAGGQRPLPEHQDPGGVRRTSSTPSSTGTSRPSPSRTCDGRSLYIPRGKSLGGSSSMNAMLYVRGRPLDYDLWEAQGAPGWGWTRRAAVLPRAPRTTRAAPRSSTAPAGRCASPSSARRGRSTGACSPPARRPGIPRIDDYNGPEQDGVSMFQVTQRNGRRWSAADAFLRPALKRPNLEVLTGATVLGLELEGDRAVGVRYRAGAAREQVARAEREVILAAGAIGSPQLLLLSGIGPADELREAGVELAPRAAGRRAQPPGPPVRDAALGGLRPDDALRRRQAQARWPSGCCAAPASSPRRVAEVVAFVRTRAGLPAADIQFHMGAAYFEDHGAEEFDGHAMVIAPGARQRRRRAGRCGCARPTRPPSRGSSPTRCPSPTTSSRWSPACELAREIAAPGAAARDRRARAQARARRRRARGARGRPAPAADADLPPGRHLPDERRRATRSSTRSCACTASRACASSTPRSCR